MKKVGIITMYHGSSNYGGLLQAYALCKYLNDNGFEAEQISYAAIPSSSDKKEYYKKILKEKNIKIIKKAITDRGKGLLTKVFLQNHIARKKNATDLFRELIPHSKKIYHRESVHECNGKYDIFITGSDRVWNIENITSPYFLGFVQEKKKYSYAASLTTNSLSDEQKERLFKELTTYAGISVREKETSELLSLLNAQWVADPTLLLNMDEWDKVSGARLVEEEYVFCYFLGSDRDNRQRAAQFAKKKNLKVVTIPYGNNQLVFSDIGFGDRQFVEVTPNDFISLIKFSNYVFTDSFHATVFSTIYKKEVFSFLRKDKKNSGTRLQSLTTLFGTESHFCDGKEKKSVNYIMNVEPIDYEAVYNNLSSLVVSSKEFIEHMK